MTDGFAFSCKSDESILNAGVLVFKNDTPLDWPSLTRSPLTSQLLSFVPAGEAGTITSSCFLPNRTFDERMILRRLYMVLMIRQKIADAINAGIAE